MWEWFALGAGLVLAVVLVVMSRARARRRRSLQGRASVGGKPVAPAATQELVDLALRKREEQIAENRRRMQPAAALTSSTTPMPASSVRSPSPPPEPQPVFEVSAEPAAGPANPLERLALQQWEDVDVVRPGALPATINRKSTVSDGSGFELRPSSKRNAPKPLDVDWGTVEVRQDTRRTGER